MKARIFLLIHLLATTGFGYSQKQGQALIDSLMKELPPSKNDTNKVVLLNRISRAYIGIDPDHAFKFSKDALNLAEQLKWPKGKAVAYYNRGVYHSSIGNYPEAMNDHIVSMDLYKTISDKKGIADNYNSFAIVKIYQGSIDAAIKYLDTTLNIRKEIGDKKGEADTYNNLGSFYQYTGKLPEALLNYEAALQIYIKLNDKERMSAAYNNIGTVRRIQGNYPEALNCHLMALKVDEGLKNLSNLITDNTNIANVYFGQKIYPESLKYYIVALELAQKIKDRASEGAISNNIGEAHYLLGNSSLALHFDSIALKIGIEIGDLRTVANAYSKMGTVHSALKNLPKALQSYEQGLNLFRKLRDSILIANTYSNIGIVYWEQKKYREAEQHQKTALNISRQLGETSVQMSAHEALSKMYTSLNRYPEALQHYQQYIALKDSSESNEVARKITQLQARYEFDIKADSIRLHNEKRLAITEEKNKEKIRTGLIISSFLLLLLLVGFYFYRKRERDRFELAQMQLKQDVLKARLDTHFVKGTLEGISGLIETGDKKTASDYHRKFSRIIRDVLDNSFKTSVTLKEEIDFIEDYVQLAQLPYGKNHIEFRFTIEKLIEPGNTLVPPMVLLVFVENAIRYAFNAERGGVLQVRIIRNGEMLQCTVEDNGVGRKATQAMKEENRPSYGTSLAEKLLKVWTPNNQAGIEIEDIVDAEGNPSGTRAMFSFSLTTY